jgi:uncharacterized LabA/DUF88 family protein
MELSELKAQNDRKVYLQFDPTEYGRIFAIVDFGNVRYWAKSFWPEENKEFIKRGVDISRLAELIDSIKPAKKFFYYGHYKEHPELPHDHELNSKYRKSIYRIDLAAKCGFTKRTKEVKEINNFDEEGKFIGKLNKCNFDVEITMDLLLKIEKYDTVFLWSGDSDFHFLLQHLQSKKKKIITVCVRNFVSTELEENSNLFIPADPFKDILEYFPKNTPAIASGR